MSTPLGFMTLLRRSLVHRRARSVSALVALTVSAAATTALLTLYKDLDSKLHKEFRSFGANVVITASAGGALPPGALAHIKGELGSEALAAEFAYAVATTDRGTPVVVAGVNFDSIKKLDSWWQVDSWPISSDADVALLGQHAAQFVANERSVTLTYADRSLTLHGIGRLRTGGDEDSRIYIPLATFTEWTGISPSVIELQIAGGGPQIENAIARLKSSMPDVKVDPVRQLVEGETRIVDKTHALMYGALLLIALTVAISVLATLSASVLERRRDFALMRALGGSAMQLMTTFLAEALVLSIAGVIAGYVIGSSLAWIISQLNFHTATMPRFGVLPVVLLLNLVIAGLAALLPVRVLHGLQPAALLKGE